MKHNVLLTKFNRVICCVNVLLNKLKMITCGVNVLQIKLKMITCGVNVLLIKLIMITCGVNVWPNQVAYAYATMLPPKNLERSLACPFIVLHQMK